MIGRDLVVSRQTCSGAAIGAVTGGHLLDLTIRAPCHLSEILDHNIDGSAWVAEVNGWIGIVPARSDDEFLLSVTEGGREALSLSMDIHGGDSFTYARDGRVVVSFEPTWPKERLGDDPHFGGFGAYGVRHEDIDGVTQNPRLAQLAQMGVGLSSDARPQLGRRPFGEVPAGVGQEFAPPRLLLAHAGGKKRPRAVRDAGAQPGHVRHDRARTHESRVNTSVMGPVADGPRTRQPASPPGTVGGRLPRSLEVAGRTGQPFGFMM
ncbi:DUF6461 domain-containing protein [Nonomuraea indica]|uniref:DUF6461 domain-containing protein n=1 Tax=Nonomuraea indica TaxID=1581193 RepID=A0ABW8A350_9ACTN